MDDATQTQQEQLHALLQKNLTDYHKFLQGWQPDMLIDMAGHIAAVAEVFEYLTTKYEYRPGEIEVLLAQENPLDELADAWQVQREDVADMGYILRSYCDEKDLPELPEMDTAAREETLRARLDASLAAYKGRMLALTKKEMYDHAGEISAVEDAHYYLTEEYSFAPEELEYLLQFKDPLDLVSTEWQNNRGNMKDMPYILEAIFGSDYYLSLYEHAPAEPPAPAAGQDGKPSVLAALRQGTEQAKQQPEPETQPKNHKKMEETL